MKRLSFIAVLILSLSFSFQAKAGRIVTDSIQSQILGTWVKYNVYLPDGFEKSGEQYPVLYLLHGWSDDYTAWQKKGLMHLVCNELMASGESDKMVVVMPNAGTADINNTWCGYFNMKGWNYADFFFKELMPNAEKKYRVIGDKKHRAVSGLSMGGGGSVVYCQTHPELFAACYAMSAWFRDKVTNRADEKSEKVYLLKQAVYDHDPATFVNNADEATLEKLRSVAWFLDCGDDDALLFVNEKFHKSMLDKRVPIQFRVRNGSHNWEYWHYGLRQALPFISRQFSK